MHDYIIDPLWFYIMDVFKKINFISGFGIFLLLVLGFFSLGVEEDEYGNNKWPGLFGKLAVVCAAIFIVVPSSESCKSMIAASLITNENLSYTKEEAMKFVDYVFEKIEDWQDESSN